MANEFKLARIEMENNLRKELLEKIKENQELTITNKIIQQKIEIYTNKARENL